MDEKVGRRYGFQGGCRESGHLLIFYPIYVIFVPLLENSNAHNFWNLRIKSLSYIRKLFILYCTLDTLD